ALCDESRLYFGHDSWLLSCQTIMARLFTAIIFIALAGFDFLAAWPETRYALPGLWHGESFYRGRPTSYWSWRFQQYYMRTRDLPAWLEELMPFARQHDPRLAVIWDAKAVPMLGQLILDNDHIVGGMAADILLDMSINGRNQK